MKFAKSPGWIRVQYGVTISSVLRLHQFDVGIWPVAWNGSGTLLKRRPDGSATVLWTTAINALIGVLDDVMPNTASFIVTSLFRQDNASSEPLHIADNANVSPGLVAQSPLPYQQLIWSFRTGAGGIMKLSIYETHLAVNTRQNYASMGATYKAVADLVTASDTWVYARDNSFPTTSLFLTTKTNDELRKQGLNL